METIGDITVDHHVPGSFVTSIKQDDDVVVLYKDELEGVADALRADTSFSPTPEKWYVVLKNSNIRLTNLPNVPTVFTTYSAARMYAREYGGLERTYCPISADEYELAFGR